MYGVSYRRFQQLLPFEAETPDYEAILGQMQVQMELKGPVLEDEGMHVFEHWGGQYRPLEELIREMDGIKAQNRQK